ncbi:ribonuclease P protein component [Candidatus Dependentiae bacterium]|nr:ribonuclease P protein component [Candidatus Dependentiae bacterium]
MISINFNHPPKKISKFSKKELDTFFKKAKCLYKNQALTFLIHPKMAQFGRILISIPKKYGNAPERNLIKRRLKSLFIEEKWYEKPYDFAFMVKPQAKDLSFAQLKEIMLHVAF